MQNIVEATKSFEAWIGDQVTLIRADLNYKHEQMAADVFRFLRATFYRWAQLYPALCPELVDAPKVLSVGDLHAENFGTWRDTDGRLVWGINDFDEAFELPYTNDLVRLAASVKLAIEAKTLSVDVATANEAILDGYGEWLESGGRPFVLAEKAGWLRLLAETQLRDPVAFWEKIDALPRLSMAAPREALALLKSSLPEPDVEVKVCARRAGMGSLGRVRIVTAGHWRGGMIAREAKAMAPSACVWATGLKKFDDIFDQKIRSTAVRCPDPIMRTDKRWVVRRLSPSCAKIELAEMPKADAARFLHAMGRETANIHLGSRKAIAAVKKDFTRLRKESPNWLGQGVDSMVAQTRADWKFWRNAK